MLEKLQEWDFPPTEWEVSVCNDLLNLVAVYVQRAPKDQLEQMGRRSNECHSNVRWYVKNDPEHLSKAVSGWILENSCFTLHSVIEQDGRLICIAPNFFSDDRFLFVPDDKIEWIEDGDVFRAIRNGQSVGPGVRIHPQFTMAQSQMVRSRLLAGASPTEAMKFTKEEFEVLKSKYELRGR